MRRNVDLSASSPSRRSPLTAWVLAIALALAASAASAQIRTVLVSPVPGNATASGTALRNALAGIASPSSTNPWLLKVEPGIYDIGNTSLPMRAWVDIEGAGIGVTTIQGSVDASGLNAGTINGADNAELRSLTVKATAGGAVTSVIAIYNPATSPRLYRVKMVSTGQSAWGLRNVSGAPRIEECEVTVTGTGSGFTYGMVFNATSGLPAGRTSILRTQVAVTGASTNTGIFLEAGLIVTEIRNSRFDVTGGATSYGLYGHGLLGWTGGGTLSVRDSDFNVGGSTGSAYGVRFESGANIYLALYNSQVWGYSAPNSYAVYHYGNSAVVAQGSSLIGATRVLDVFGNASIASTSMSGGPANVSGWLGCMGVWDENAVFYANSCPP